jgi:hypothetical protein
MNWIATGGLAVGGCTALSVAGLLLIRLRSYRNTPEGEPEGGDGFSLSRYEPMSRLLAEDDFRFLAAHPGYRPEIGAKLRRARRGIFRLYLRELASDFRWLHAEARQMVAESQAQHAELVGLLLRQQVTFWRAMALIEFRLLTDRAGLGKAEIGGLLEAVEAMRLDLARLAPATPGL